ncbi:MAG: hypothetical protein FJ316_07535 [SAR202 cluster bacterium]|nr:hypothetical protein [SAR202 cluster bacterium]
MPTFNVTPSYYARALAAAVAVAVVGGVVWGVINASFLGRIPFVSAAFALGVGYLAGELISLAANRKRGTGLAWIAGGTVAAAFLITWMLRSFPFDLWGFLFLAVGIFIAVQRVRR